MTTQVTLSSRNPSTALARRDRKTSCRGNGVNRRVKSSSQPLLVVLSSPIRAHGLQWADSSFPSVFLSARLPLNLLAKRALIRHFAFEVAKAFVDERRTAHAEADVDRERILPEQKVERSYYAHQCD
jgi:hypothetical protein